MAKPNKKYGYEPDYAIAPGMTLRDTIAELEMSQKNLALRTGLTVQSINRIIKGEQPISYETANKLELVTGVPAGMWNNLESRYQERKAKIEERERLAKDIEWLKTIPLKELIARGKVQKTEERQEQLREVLKFFGVSSVGAWHDIWQSPKGIAARRSTCFETKPGAASAWIRIGELKALRVDCKPYNKDKFARAIGEIRKLTVESPAVFIPKIEKLCAESGVAFVLVPELKKVPWNGATMWLTPEKVMLLMNIRGKYEDKFWFSFFHEAKHILKDNKKDLYINDGEAAEKIEQEADRFAADFLIHPKYNAQIKTLGSKIKIVKFAEVLGLSPGIVVGRYQFLTQKWHFYKDLQKKFE